MTRHNQISSSPAALLAAFKNGLREGAQPFIPALKLLLSSFPAGMALILLGITLALGKLPQLGGWLALAGSVWIAIGCIRAWLLIIQLTMKSGGGH